MIDIRRLRADPEGVKAALARRGVDPTEIDRAIGLDRRERDVVATQRDEIRNRVKTLSREVGALRKAGDVAGRRGAAGREPRRSATRARSRVARRGHRSRAALVLLGTPNLPSEDAPDGAGPEDNPVLRVVGYDRARTGPTSVCRTGTSARSSASSISSAARRCPARCSRCSAAPARPSAGRSCQFALDLNSDAFEEIRPPTLVRTDTMVSHRSPAEVRRRGVPPGTRRPVGDPDGRGAAHVARSRRGARRGRSPDAADGLHAVLPPRGRLGGA